MAGFSPIALGASKKFTQETIEGSGSIQGKPCQILSINHDDVKKQNEVQFGWVDDAGIINTQTMIVPDGIDGNDGKDGISPHIDSTSGNWFIGDLDTGVEARGEKGEKGEAGADGTTYTPTIGTVTAGDELAVTVSIDEDKKEAKFNFVIPSLKVEYPIKINEDGKPYITVQEEVTE